LSFSNSSMILRKLLGRAFLILFSPEGVVQGICFHLFFRIGSQAFSSGIVSIAGTRESFAVRTQAAFASAHPARSQRREQLDVVALKAQHGGDVKMPELLSRLVADCPRQRQRAFSISDRCRAIYDETNRYGP
jgi:hypothetical protein